VGDIDAPADEPEDHPHVPPFEVDRELAEIG
jgi:hypothetical protein